MNGYGVLENAVLKMDTKATLRTIKKLIKEEGWKSVLKQLRNHLNRSVGKAWYARNWFFLSILDSVGLMGIEADVEKILARVDDEYEFNKVLEEASEKLIRSARRQLRNGGSTLFFDLELMKTERSAVLIDEVVRARQKEFLQCAENQWDNLRYTHHGLLLQYATWLIEEGSDHEDGQPLWEFDETEIEEGQIEDYHREFGEDRSADLLGEAYKFTVSDRTISIIDALLATPEESEHWWARFGYGGEECLKPLVYSGLIDAVHLLEVGEDAWRAIPSSLKEIFDRFPIKSTEPFAVSFLLELDYPIIPKVLARTLKGEEAAWNSGPNHIIENMSDKQIEENLKTLVEFFVASDWGDSGEYGPSAPESVEAASKAIEKKAYLLTQKQRKEMKESAHRWLGKWYTAGSVYQVNELVLRTQGPDAIEYAKESLINWYDWESIEIPYFIDENMVKFLKSKGIDPYPILVQKVIDLFKRGLDHAYGATQAAMEFHPEVAQAIRIGLLDQELYDSYIMWWDHIFGEEEKIKKNLFQVRYPEPDSEYSWFYEILGHQGLFATLGEVMLALIAKEELKTLHGRITESLSMYNEEYSRIEFADDVYNEYKSSKLYSKLGAAAAIIQHISELDRKVQRKQVLEALQYPHVKSMIGAAAFMWITGTKTDKLIDVLRNTSLKKSFLEHVLGHLK
ncbi:MAG: hypothetical protein ACFFER_16050 [Candidatus Thorarchaeota archaeon]